MHYDADTLAEGKRKCKAALQKELGLPVKPDVPVLGFIGRLDYQKVGWDGCMLDWIGCLNHQKVG
jgi:glycogen synthase